MLQWNVRSLRARLDDLTVLLYSYSTIPEFLCFSEKWLNVTDRCISFPNHNFVYACRNGAGGGVCIDTRKDIMFQSVDLSDLQAYCMDLNIDVCAVQFT